MELITDVMELAKVKPEGRWASFCWSMPSPERHDTTIPTMTTGLRGRNNTQTNIHVYCRFHKLKCTSQSVSIQSYPNYMYPAFNSETYSTKVQLNVHVPKFTYTKISHFTHAHNLFVAVGLFSWILSMPSKKCEASPGSTLWREFSQEKNVCILRSF